MVAFNNKFEDYRLQVEKGTIVDAYRRIMKFMRDLQAHFMKTYPNINVSTNLYQGYMDMTYFSVAHPILKDRRLKIAIVFIHETTSFEVWLSGVNRKVQKDYWKKFLESGWDRYMVVPVIENKDAIIQNVIVNDPDFEDLEGLIVLIEEGVMEFMDDIVDFLLGEKMACKICDIEGG